MPSPWRNTQHARYLAGMVVAVCTGSMCQTSYSQALPEAQVVARRGNAEITVAEFQAKIRTLPPELRDGYVQDAERFSRMLDTMLLIEQSAHEAIAQGHDQGPQFAEDLELARLELISRQQIERHITLADMPNMERLAREQYLADPKPYTISGEMDLRHALIDTDGHDDAQAKARAEELRQRALKGEEFAALVAEYSDDQALKDRGGLLEKVDLSKLDAAFATAALKLTKAGDVSDVVRSRFGYHVIRIERKTDARVQPFEAVKDQIVKQLKTDFIESEKGRYLSGFSKQKFELNGELVKHLVQSTRPSATP